VNFVDPAPAIARRVVDLLGPAAPKASAGSAYAVFTSDHAPQAVLARFGIAVRAPERSAAR
jgi:glutamate racemase